MDQRAHQDRGEANGGWRRSVTPRPRRLGSWLLLLLVVVGAFVARVSGHMVDFEVDYRAGQRLLRGEPLYQVGDAHYMYKYLPGAAVLEMPFALLPPMPARTVFYALTVGCLLGVLVLSYRLLPDDPPKRPALMALTFLVLGKYFVREVFLGQINLVITALLLLVVWHLRASAERGSPAREAAAGALWGVATTLKPYGLVFLPYLVITRRWRALLAGLGVAGLAAVAPVPFYGVRGTVDQHVAWAITLADSSPQLLTNVDNTSLFGFFAKWTGNAEMATVLLGAVAVVLAILIAVIVFLGRQRPGSVVLDGALLLTLIPLLAPLGWDYMLLMSTPGVMLLLHQRARFRPFWRALLVANLAVIAVTVTEVVGHTLHELYEGWVLTTVNFLVLVAFLAALRFKRAC